MTGQHYSVSRCTTQRLCPQHTSCKIAVTACPGALPPRPPPHSLSHGANHKCVCCMKSEASTSQHFVSSRNFATTATASAGEPAFSNATPSLAVGPSAPQRIKSGTPPSLIAGSFLQAFASQLSQCWQPGKLLFGAWWSLHHSA